MLVPLIRIAQNASLKGTVMLAPFPRREKGIAVLMKLLIGPARDHRGEQYLAAEQTVDE